MKPPRRPDSNKSVSYKPGGIHSEWQHYYNWDRPHSSLNGKTPIERLTELYDQIPLWEEISAKFDQGKERIREQNYHADLAIQKLKRCL